MSSHSEGGQGLRAPCEATSGEIVPFPEPPWGWQHLEHSPWWGGDGVLPLGQEGEG